MIQAKGTGGSGVGVGSILKKVVRGSLRRRHLSRAEGVQE